MFRKIIWPLLLFASISLIAVFVTGLVTSIRVSNATHTDTTSEIESTSPNSTQDTVQNDNDSDVVNDNPRILILGDSIGYGVGDDPDQGIGRRYAEMLDSEGIQDVKVTNLSISGAKVSELYDLVKRPENAEALSEATLIILSIGGNDLNNIDDQDILSLDINYKETLTRYLEALQGIVTRIRALNQSAQVAIVGLYDPYAENDIYKTDLLLKWNYETQRIAAADFKTIYIPTYDLFQYNLNTYLAFDQFHPSSVGYQAIAEALYRSLHGINDMDE